MYANYYVCEADYVKGDQLWKVKHKLGGNLKFLFRRKKGNFNKVPEKPFSKSSDDGIQTFYSRLNSTSSVSIFQMTLTSLPVQFPRAL